MTEEVFRDDPYARRCDARVTAVGPDGIRLDRTVFYPTGGGQPGDTGILRMSDGREIRIVGTVKGGEGGEPLHQPAPDAPLPATGDSVVAEINWDRRYRHMRMHTCLHLLCALLPGGVTGGAIGDGKGRLDFDLPGEAPDRERLERDLNHLIAADHPLAVRWIGDDELVANPDLVRTMSVKPPRGSGRVRLIEIPGVDLQPCGGTHVRRTGEIGRIRVAKIESKGRHNRRINLVLDA